MMPLVGMPRKGGSSHIAPCQDLADGAFEKRSLPRVCTVFAYATTVLVHVASVSACSTEAFGQNPPGPTVLKCVLARSVVRASARLECDNGVRQRIQREPRVDGRPEEGGAIGGCGPELCGSEKLRTPARPRAPKSSLPMLLRRPQVSSAWQIAMRICWCCRRRGAAKQKVQGREGGVPGCSLREPGRLVSWLLRQARQVPQGGNGAVAGRAMDDHDVAAETAEVENPGGLCATNDG